MTLTLSVLPKRNASSTNASLIPLVFPPFFFKKDSANILVPAASITSQRPSHPSTIKSSLPSKSISLMSGSGTIHSKRKFPNALDTATIPFTLATPFSSLTNPPKLSMRRFSDWKVVEILVAGEISGYRWHLLLVWACEGWSSRCFRQIFDIKRRRSHQPMQRKVFCLW